MSTTPVILDCDTGSDDAVAIMLAARHPDLDLLGVSTVWGNHDVRDTTDNTLRVLARIGREDVGVHPGANGPVRPRICALPSGRDDLAPHLPLPAATAEPGAPAAEWLVETLRGATVPVTLVATGPLTNVAAVVAADPALIEAVGRLVVLGGTYRRSGATSYAERNVWCDPEAAHDVLTAGFRDILLVTMDATFSAPLTGEDVARLRGAGTPASETAADLLCERISWYRRDETMLALHGAPLHDPLAVACLVDPEVVVARPAAVTVERSDPVAYGATRFAFGPDTCAGSGVRVALKAHRDRFVDLLVRTLGDWVRPDAR